MDFKGWLQLYENACRTGAKYPLYPPSYCTHPYDYLGVKMYHIPTAADAIYYLDAKLAPFKWKNFDFTNESPPNIF